MPNGFQIENHLLEQKYEEKNVGFYRIQRVFCIVFGNKKYTSRKFCIKRSNFTLKFAKSKVRDIFFKAEILHVKSTFHTINNKVEKRKNLLVVLNKFETTRIIMTMIFYRCTFNFSCIKQ